MGAFEDGRCVAVAGFRVIHNLAWGDCLYVDDLSTHPDGRRRGLGRALLDWCEAEAARLGCGELHLDSGVGPDREDAHRLLQHRAADHELPLREAGRRLAAVIESAARLALVAERELEALVGVSSPSGDVPGAEECAALAIAFLPPEAEVERLPCSTPGYAPDLCGRLRGSGTNACCCSVTSTPWWRTARTGRSIATATA